MSLASWKEEFYPTPAYACPCNQALEHSILKWTGLLPENLEKHQVFLEAHYLHDAESPNCALRIDGDSCALCVHYCAEGICRSEEACPILLVTGADCSRAYQEFVYQGQASPMLDLLNRVEEALNAPQA